jgi:NADP-dependent 3-hydroxy acid dehydrogenase YdfG
VDAETTKALITAAGRECLLLPQDIRDEEGCKRVIKSVVDAWGRIDVLVNNASVMVCAPILIQEHVGLLRDCSTPSLTSWM